MAGRHGLYVMILLTPGQQIDDGAARAALADASAAPLSVVALGLGDGPFHAIGRLAAAVPEAFHAVDFHGDRRQVPRSEPRARGVPGDRGAAREEIAVR